MVAAILTILGYSTNDKVVVYDRVRENLRKYKTMPLRDLIDLSINETLSRTLGTSMTVFLASLPLALFGGASLSGFRLGDAVRHRRRHLLVDLHCRADPAVPGRDTGCAAARPPRSSLPRRLPGSPAAASSQPPANIEVIQQSAIHPVVKMGNGRWVLFLYFVTAPYPPLPDFTDRPVSSIDRTNGKIRLARRLPQL